MAAKSKLTVSIAPTKSARQTGAERRDALTAALVTEQADLKRDAAQRRSEREARAASE